MINANAINREFLQSVIKGNWQQRVNFEAVLCDACLPRVEQSASSFWHRLVLRFQCFFFFLVFANLTFWCACEEVCTLFVTLMTPHPKHRLNCGSFEFYLLERDAFMERFVGREAVALKRVKRILHDYPALALQDEKLLELHCFLKSRKRACTVPLSIPDVGFDVDRWLEQDMHNDFRFNRDQAELLARFLFPSSEKQSTPNRHSFHRVEGTCILLRVLMSPARLCDHRVIFGRSISAISEIANYVAGMLSEKAWRVFHHIDEETLGSQEFVEGIRSVTGMETRISYLVDGKLWDTCDFSNALGVLYNGDKKRDGIKSMHLVGPDGICYFMHGPFYGERHDSGCFSISGKSIQACSWVRESLARRASAKKPKTTGEKKEKWLKTSGAALRGIVSTTA